MTVYRKYKMGYTKLKDNGEAAAVAEEEKKKVRIRT